MSVQQQYSGSAKKKKSTESLIPFSKKELYGRKSRRYSGGRSWQAVKIATSSDVANVMAITSFGVKIGDLNNRNLFLFFLSFFVQF